MAGTAPPESHAGRRRKRTKNRPRARKSPIGLAQHLRRFIPPGHFAKPFVNGPPVAWNP